MAAETDYRTYLNIVLKKKFLFTAIVLSVCTLGIILTYLWPEKYEAQSTVFIEKSVINDLVEGIAVTQSVEGPLKVLTHRLGSRNLLQKVIDNLDVDLVGKDSANAQALIKDFQKNTKVTIKENDLFIIQYANASPRLARDYVNTLIRKYIDDNLSASRQESYGANRFLSEQMEHFRGKIQEAENRLALYKQQYGYASFVDDSGLLGEIRQAEAMLDQLQTQKTTLQARKALLNRGSISGGTASEHLGALQRQRDQLLLVYTDNYPEVILINAEIQQVKEAMKNHKPDAEPIVEDGSVEGTLLNIELDAVLNKEENLQRTLLEKKAILADLPERRNVYNSLLRDRETYQHTYDQLVLRYGKSELSKQMEIQDKVDTFRIVDPAVLPDRPVSPNRVSAILLSLFAGLVAGLGILYALNYFDDSVKSIDSVQEIGIPLLALIPQFVTTEEKVRQRQQAMSLSIFVGVYLLSYSMVLGYEVLQMIDIPIFDRFLESLPFGRQVADLGEMFRHTMLGRVS
ncbi:MAG: XrtA system polysaccharide chain length determinant [Desulfuromonadales bacterium]